MAGSLDQDRFFTGVLDASTPRALLSEGSISRLLNGRFVHGAISNAIGFEELQVSYFEGNDKRVFARAATYGDILSRGVIQLLAPLRNVQGDFLIAVISGILFSIDLSTNLAYDITPPDAFLPEGLLPWEAPLSYIDNDGDVSGVGGYLVIFNYPQRPILVTPDGARLSEESSYEVPPSRLGVTGGNRAAVVSGNNLVYASDPLGGASPLGPLNFEETLAPGADFFGQILTVGSVLDLAKVTAAARMISLFTPAEDFLASSIVFFTENARYVFSIGLPRDAWDSSASEIIRYAGSGPGAAGPLAVTNAGTAVFFIDSQGRVKTLSQDLERDNTLTEFFFDAPIGQFLGKDEINFHFRPWYEDLNHKYSNIKYSGGRLFGTVSPFSVDGLDQHKRSISAVSHRALSVASIADENSIGASSSLAWQGFYDWLYPVALATLRQRLFVASKDPHGRNRFYKEDLGSLDPNPTTIYTRGYFGMDMAESKSFVRGSLFFRELSEGLRVSISVLIDNKWKTVVCEEPVRKQKYMFRLNHKLRTDSASIPLRIEIFHDGGRFELESISAYGEVHYQEKG